MQIVHKYSGLLIIFVAWAFLLLPFLFHRKKYLTISHMGLSNKYSAYINFGVVLSGILQVIFSNFLHQRISNDILSIGPYLLGGGGAFFVLAGFLNRKQTFRIHSLLIKIYSACTIAGSIFVSFYFGKTLLVISIVLLLGSLYLYFRKKYWASEIWTILFFSLWTISLYILIL